MWGILVWKHFVMMGQEGRGKKRDAMMMMVDLRHGRRKMRRSDEEPSKPDLFWCRLSERSESRVGVTQVKRHIQYNTSWHPLVLRTFVFDDNKLLKPFRRVVHISFFYFILTPPTTIFTPSWILILPRKFAVVTSTPMNRTSLASS